MYDFDQIDNQKGKICWWTIPVKSSYVKTGVARNALMIYDARKIDKNQNECCACITYINLWLRRPRGRPYVGVSSRVQAGCEIKLEAPSIGQIGRAHV